MGEMEIIRPGDWDYCAACLKPTPLREGEIITEADLELFLICHKCLGRVRHAMSEIERQAKESDQ